MKKIVQSNLFVQIIKFGLVGFMAFFIDYVILILCKELLSFHILFATAIAFTISVLFNYLASVKWVFEVDEEKSKKNNFILFITFSIIGLLITEVIMYIGTDTLKISYLIVKIFATGVVMIFNFVTRKLFLEKKTVK